MTAYDAARWRAAQVSLTRLAAAQTLPGPANTPEAHQFMAWLDANAAEVETWPKWKRDAFVLVKEPSDG